MAAILKFKMTDQKTCWYIENSFVLMYEVLTNLIKQTEYNIPIEILMTYMRLTCERLCM